jgi:hypothetical protein
VNHKSDIVYVLGAGLNQPLRHAATGISPPMIRNFFQMFLKGQEEWQSAGWRDVDPLFDYIHKYWHLSKGELRSRPLDLEEVFTFITLEREEARRRRQHQEARRLGDLLFILTSMLGYLLGPFEDLGVQDVNAALYMHEFGGRLLQEEPAVITFNYDTILERAIETASGTADPLPYRERVLDDSYTVPEEELGYSRFNWNRALCYGFKFDEVQLDQGELAPIENGRRFYDHPANNLHQWRILKVHGSLNWSKYAPEDRRPKPESSFRKEEAVFLLQPRWDLAQRRQHKGRVIDPVIITPVLNKDSFYRSAPFPGIWRQAGEALSRCKKLIIIGYSLPPTDFAFKRLLLEAFRLARTTSTTWQSLIRLKCCCAREGARALRGAGDLLHVSPGVPERSQLDATLNQHSYLGVAKSRANSGSLGQGISLPVT